MNNQQNMIYISGPISITIIIIDSIKYIFIADIHGNFGGECNIVPDLILTFNNTLNYISNGNKCLGMGALIYNMIIAEKHINNRKLDIFIESTYKSDNHLHSSINMKDGHLKMLYLTYADCFKNNNSKCQFDNVNMYNIDIRSLVKDNSDIYQPDYHISICLYTLIYNIKNIGSIDSNSLQLYNFLYTIIPFMYTTDIKCMNNSIKLFNICMESNDYYKDVCKLFNMKSLFDNILGLPDNIYTHKFKECLFNHLIVKKNNLIIHKIKSQYISLAYEGKQHIADSIKKYVYDKASKLICNNNILSYWNNIRSFYINQNNNSLLNYILSSGSIVDVIFSTYICYYMDAYSLGKLFINSDNVNKKIIYAGDYHIKLYIDFIKNKFNNININYYGYIPNYKRCVPVPISELLI